MRRLDDARDDGDVSLQSDVMELLDQLARCLVCNDPLIPGRNSDGMCPHCSEGRSAARLNAR